VSSPSPTSRSLALLRQRGYVAEKVEQRLTFKGFVTRDLFGCIDLLACRPGEIVGVQTTSRSNLSSRRLKSMNCPGLLAFLQAGGRFRLHGWGKVGAKGQRKTWQCAEQELTITDVEAFQKAVAE
jgi:hypothetical protein